MTTTPITAEAARAPQVGLATGVQPNQPAQPVAPPARPVTPQPATVAAGVQAANIKNAPPPPSGLVSRSTKSITSPWMRGCIYGETDSWKSTTAAKFGSIEDVRILLTREESQLLPLRDYGYEFAQAKTYDRFRYVMMYPEKIWPDWATRENRIFIIDDVTAGKDIVVDSNETDAQGNALKDNRMVHREAKADIGDMVKSLQSKPMHIIFVALAKIYENKFTHRETVSPDLPPAMLTMMTADWDYVFYSDKEKKMLLTGNKVETYQSKDEKGKMQTYTRSVFAKNKLPRDLVGKFLMEYEQHDLQAIWQKIQSAKGAK